LKETIQMVLPKAYRLSIRDVIQITPARHGDARGFFSETYNRVAFQEVGIDCEFIQDNHALSRDRGTIRGMHFQIPPFAQAKLVRVVRGAIWDVAVDIRRGSPTYGQSCAAMLSAENGCQLFVPRGFAHAYCTTEPDTEVLYKVDAPYSREHERGLLWNDPALQIAWPITGVESILLERDRQHPPLRELNNFFSYSQDGSGISE
jgi:dTDP-4-dehydrorhamnose 3,5-epimerase